MRAYDDGDAEDILLTNPRRHAGLFQRRLRSKLRLLAQAANCPVHLAAMQYSADSALQRFPMEGLKPGDVIALNDPYRGGTHINDITFTMPIFFEGELLGFAVSRGHWMDLGGGAAGGQSFGTHIAAEGLRLPPIKLYENYKMNEDFLAIIMNNTRTPHFVKGDLQAHLGALKSAEVELQRAASRYGVETVKAAMTELIAYTERVVRKAIEDIPDGVYEAEDYADTDGFSEDPVKVKVSADGKRIGNHGRFRRIRSDLQRRDQFALRQYRIGGLLLASVLPGAACPVKFRHVRADQDRRARQLLAECEMARTDHRMHDDRLFKNHQRDLAGFGEGNSRSRDRIYLLRMQLVRGVDQGSCKERRTCSPTFPPAAGVERRSMTA